MKGEETEPEQQRNYYSNTTYCLLRGKNMLWKKVQVLLTDYSKDKYDFMSLSWRCKTPNIKENILN